MKPLLAVLCSAILVATGCALLSGHPRIISASKAASYIGTAEAIRQNPDLRTNFTEARDALMLLETSEDVDVITVVAVLDRLPIKELKGEHSSIIINGSMILIVDAGTSLPLADVKGLQTWVRAVRQGMDLALGAYATIP